ncbi:MAG: hypothetical protein N3D72_00670 [Candidatus Methanomethyliaceae archaeon]|nr:hypothetical protein [Candidatus Methanomethyliaceae archaeon]
MNRITDKKLIAMLNRLDERELRNLFSKCTYEELKEGINNYIRVKEVAKNAVELFFDSITLISKKDNEN